MSNPRTLAIFAAVGILIVITNDLLWQPASADSPANCKSFPQTRRVVCGRFLAFWKQYGGTRIFGLPITNEVSEDTADGKFRTVQYFERAVFELHTENKPPYEVQLSRLGSFQYSARYPRGSKEADFPLYPNAKVTNVRVHPAQGNVRLTTFTTADKPIAVFNFYKDVLLKNGWDLDRESGSSLSFGYIEEPTSPCNPSDPTCLGGTAYTVNVDVLTTNPTTISIEFIKQPPK
jgi:hypothetical protein